MYKRIGMKKKKSSVESRGKRWKKEGNKGKEGKRERGGGGHMREFQASGRPRVKSEQSPVN